MTVPSGCAEWTHPPSDDVDLSFGSPPSTQHNRVDLRWCEELEPEPEQPVILPSGGTSTKIAAGTSVNLQFGPESVLAHDGVHLVWGEGATDPDAPPQRSAFYGLGGASQAQAAELAQMAADGTEATIQAITTTQSPNNPDDRTPVADADAVAKDWDEQTRRIRLPTDNTDRAPDDMERVVTPQTVQRTLTLDLTKIGMLSAKINTLLFHIHQVRRSRINAISRLRALEAIGDNPIRGAWCADYTEDLSGEVATVEVPAEADSSVLRPQIRPGYAGRANYLPARDGQMFHREGQQGYQAYFNAAILPGVQRWRPQYRIGTISAINSEADTCTVQLQSEDSSAQSLIIDPPNLQYTLNNVPIEYMDCNSLAFEDGDRVLLEFQGRNWSSPKVIGFEKEPKPCGCDFPFGAMAKPPLGAQRNLVQCYILKTSEQICIDNAYIGTVSGTRHQVAVYKAIPSEPESEYHMPFTFGELLWEGITSHYDHLGGLSRMFASPPIVIDADEYIVIAAWAQWTSFQNDPYGIVAESEHPQVPPSWASELHPMPGTTGTSVDMGWFEFAPAPYGSDPTFNIIGAAGMVGRQPWNGAWRNIAGVITPRTNEIHYRIGINRTREEIEDNE